MACKMMLNCWGPLQDIYLDDFKIFRFFGHRHGVSMWVKTADSSKRRDVWMTNIGSSLKVDDGVDLSTSSQLQRLIPAGAVYLGFQDAI